MKNPNMTVLQYQVYEGTLQYQYKIKKEFIIELLTFGTYNKSKKL